MLHRFLIFSLGIFIFVVSYFFVKQQTITPYDQILIPRLPQREVVLPRPKTFGFSPTAPLIEQIFSNNHQWVATLFGQHLRTLIVTGDVITARSVNYQTVKRNNFRWAWEKTADVLRNADITFINLETPLIPNCPLTNEGMIFCGDPRHLEGLTFAGIDVVNLANNHVGNYGEVGMKNTVDLLSKAGILTTGFSGPAFKDIRGLEFAFLGYDEVGREKELEIDREKIIKDISEAKKKADVVVVAFHWGVEYTSQPSDYQKKMAHLVIDSGAELVIGNHPHWIQPVEIYRDKMIVYAHGNFIFDQMWSQKTREGVVGKYTFYDDKLIDVEFLPVQIEGYSQPYFLNGKMKTQILEEMKSESLKFSN